MFSRKLWMETVTRVLLITVVVFNALLPMGTTVSAMSISDKTDPSIALSGSPQGTKGEAIKFPASSLRSPGAFPEDTSSAVPVPTVTETLASEPLDTLSAVPSATATAPIENSSPTAVDVTSTATIEITPMPSVTATSSEISTQTSISQVVSQPPVLSFRLFASPDQAGSGDEVTFTIEIVNSGNIAATGLLFSNLLPEAFTNAQGGFKDFDFDAKTRLLSWDGAKAGVSTLAPGQKLDLTYTVRLDTKLDEVQLVDSASLKADGLTEPVRTEVTLNVLSPQKRITMLDQKGGKALGLNDRIEIKLPANALKTPSGLVIKDLTDGSHPDMELQWLKFGLEMRLPKPDRAQPLEEKDRVIPLDPVEARFDQPVELAVHFDGLADLSKLEADKTPFLVTLDEISGTWVRVPLKKIDREANLISAEITHFSTWGVGFGPTFSQGANVLLFDSAYPTLFTGRSKYSIPIWTPPGRNGMQPDLTLSYSSGSVDGVLADVQAPWVGMGWSIDTAEIARKITNTTCGAGCTSYGYENKFMLLLNGTGYELLPDTSTAGRYHTKDESFLYIQLHNDSLGNNNPPLVPTNATGEWWEVVEKDGTRWQMGFTANSEQRAAMLGYPGTNPLPSPWSALGYAGHAANVVAMRWRVNQVTDVYGNQMTYTYNEEPRTVGTLTYDQASYINKISYTSHPALDAGYSVVFNLVSRGTEDVPTNHTDFDNWDTSRLSSIDIYFETSIMRTYTLGYTTRSYTDGSPSVNWQTTTLTSLATSRNPRASTPTVVFTYADQINRAANGTANKWAYPRLATINNGWGSTATYTYEHDGRASTSWYNWKVTRLEITDGIGNTKSTTYAYTTPCYDDATAGWCNPSNTGGLIGYGQTTETGWTFSGSLLSTTVHAFYTEEKLPGRERQTQVQDGAGTTISKVVNDFRYYTDNMVPGGFFAWKFSETHYLSSTSGLVNTGGSQFTWGSGTGNLTIENQFDGAGSVYRSIFYEYTTNQDPKVWILNALSKKYVWAASGGNVWVSYEQYGYDGRLPFTGEAQWLATGKPTLKRVVDVSNQTQTIDTGYVYDDYGNVTQTLKYPSYGTVGGPAAGIPLSYVTHYDDDSLTSDDQNQQNLPTSTTNPLGQSTHTHYDYGQGVPLTVTDINGKTTTYVYDPFGRIYSITYQGYNQANVIYYYPRPTGNPLSVSAPFSITMDVLDESTPLPYSYRRASQIMDGLGRVIQTQGPYQSQGMLVVTDTAYNVLGQVKFSGLPRAVTGTAGIYLAQDWNTIPHTVTAPDALGRTVSVTYPDTTHENFTYQGLRTTMTDRNSHQKIQETDAFGRLIKVEEYSGSTLYATTNYIYNESDQLTRVTDGAGNLTTIHYDGFGRKDSMTDPDLGSWTYGYDVFGNLTTQTDARNCITTVTYDDLNRPTLKSYAGPGACDATPDVTYTYDSTTGGNKGLGHRTGMSDSNSSTAWVYNILGQVTKQTLTFANESASDSYDITTNPDAFGRPISQTIPSNGGYETLNYAYNAMGALLSLSSDTTTYVSQINYEASGQVKDQLLGNAVNGLRQQFCYNANTLRMTDVRVYSNGSVACGNPLSAPLLNLSYSYQNNGNVSQVVDATRNETLTYTYDDLDRLLSVSGSYSNNYSYNNIGNLTGAILLPSTATAGQYHTCALTPGGGVKCWGKNSSGQLGDNSTTQRNAPVDVVGLTGGVSAIAAGASHTCALTTSGGVKCWGDNSSGQLGDNSTTQRNAPVDVSGLTSGVIAIAAGDYHTCALTSGGGVKCWGENSNGQLGNNSTTLSKVPVDVSSLSSGVTAIATGGAHSCALLSGSGMKCWGRNGQGQLGDNSTTQRTTPVDVNGLTSGVTYISAGYRHTCAKTTAGGLKCWGQNTNGQVGDNSTTQRNAPVDVSGLTSGVAGVKAGGNHTCARLTSGEVKCWGLNDKGQLGNGNTTQQTTPVSVITSGAVSLAAGYSHSCAIVTGGGLKCWGSNSNGQLSDGTLQYSTTPLIIKFSNYTYTYGDSAHKHVVTALATGESYTYDANGNMITRVEGGHTYTQTFDAENHLIKVKDEGSGQITQFIYDGDGNLVKKINPDNSRTLYVGGTYEVDKNAGGTVTQTRTYYPAGGAMRIGSTLYYVLKDQLGSASAVINATSGLVVGEQRYYPFGQTRLTTGTMYTDKLFTGQRQTTGLGIYNYGARFYSPYINRFLSADTIVPGYDNPQNLNRYSYTLNNPIIYTDPTGHQVIIDDDENGHPISIPWQPPNNDDNGSNPKDMETSDNGVDFIVYWEGPYYEQPYEDMGGYCTIGYGHRLFNPDGDGCSGAVRKFYRANPLSPSGAQYFLESDLTNAETYVRDTIKVNLTQAQFDALVSYVFNSGGESNQPYHEKGIPELINQGNFQAAAEAIESGPITSNNKSSDTLEDRRYAEANLFLNGIYVP